MANISRKAIKEILAKNFGVKVTESGAEKIAEILEREAVNISRFAVDHARREKRGKVTKRDISQYALKRVLDG